MKPIRRYWQSLKQNVHDWWFLFTIPLSRMAISQGGLIRKYWWILFLTLIGLWMLVRDTENKNGPSTPSIGSILNYWWIVILIPIVLSIIGMIAVRLKYREPSSQTKPAPTPTTRMSSSPAIQSVWRKKLDERIWAGAGTLAFFILTLVALRWMPGDYQESFSQVWKEMILFGLVVLMTLLVIYPKGASVLSFVVLSLVMITVIVDKGFSSGQTGQRAVSAPPIPPVSTEPILVEIETCAITLSAEDGRRTFGPIWSELGNRIDIEVEPEDAVVTILPPGDRPFKQGGKHKDDEVYLQQKSRAEWQNWIVKVDSEYQGGPVTVIASWRKSS